MRRRAVFVLVVGLVMAFAGTAMSVPGNGVGDGNGNGNGADPGQGSCDVDGVSIGYSTDFLNSPVPSSYRVTSVTVGDISPTCEGATVSVALKGGSNVIGAGTAVVSDSTAAVAIVTPSASPPAAEDIDGVHVEIAGGQIPVPPQCNGLILDRVYVGTEGDDVRSGTTFRDLMFGQAGNDSINGLQNPDCIDGGDGDDTLLGDVLDDVLIGGAGNDLLEGGVGKDRAFGSAGNDRLNGGPGNDTLFGEDGDDTIDGGTGIDRCVGGAGPDTFTACEQTSS